jgi:hypothetical protein
MSFADQRRCRFGLIATLPGAKTTIERRNPTLAGPGAGEDEPGELRGAAETVDKAGQESACPQACIGPCPCRAGGSAGTERAHRSRTLGSGPAHDP